MSDKLKLSIAVSHNNDYIENYAPAEERARWKREIAQSIINAFDLSYFEVEVKFKFEG